MICPKCKKNTLVLHLGMVGKDATSPSSMDNMLASLGLNILAPRDGQNLECRSCGYTDRKEPVSEV